MMRWQDCRINLSSSLKDVCNRIDDVGAGIREMERGWRDAHSDLSKALSEQSAQQAKEASEQRHRELLQVDQAKSALEMLDNIQNRRKNRRIRPTLPLVHPYVVPSRNLFQPVPK